MDAVDADGSDVAAVAGRAAQTLIGMQPAEREELQQLKPSDRRLRASATGATAAEIDAPARPFVGPSIPCKLSAEEMVCAAIRWQSSPVARRLQDAWRPAEVSASLGFEEAAQHSAGKDESAPSHARDSCGDAASVASLSENQPSTHPRLEEPAVAPPAKAHVLSQQELSASTEKLAVVEVSPLQDVYSSMRQLLWETAALRQQTSEIFPRATAHQHSRETLQLVSKTEAKLPEKEPEPEQPEQGAAVHDSSRARRGSWEVGLIAAASNGVRSSPASPTRAPPPRARVNRGSAGPRKMAPNPSDAKAQAISPPRLVSAPPSGRSASPEQPVRRSSPRVPNPTHSPDAALAKSTARFSPTLQGSRIDFTGEVSMADDSALSEIRHHTPSSPSLSASEQRQSEHKPTVAAKRRTAVGQPLPKSEVGALAAPPVASGQRRDTVALHDAVAHTETVQARLATMLSGVWRAVGAQSARNARATGSLASAVENVHLVVHPDGSVRGGPVPDMRLSELREKGASGESSVVLKSSNAFLIRGTVELTADGFIGQMVLHQTYFDGTVTRWSGHFFADDAKVPPDDGQQRQSLLFGGKWDGDNARGNFAARQMLPQYDLLNSFVDGVMAQLRQTS